ncbi:hypothetical protein KQX54_014186 [Cotesia glomerata]|uniref:Uncharacterized protein n=1 Tax=Cotesia glomerata TaxID=32391 RepID=A0AAV7IQ13_COTGL|nr:hypothetical protein KQX54_014186 [Cotesia glomerata]
MSAQLVRSSIPGVLAAWAGGEHHCAAFKKGERERLPLIIEGHITIDARVRQTFQSYPTERHTGTSLQSGAHRLNSVEDSAEKVEGPGTQGAKESSNDSRDEDSANDISSTLSGLLAGLPALPGPQRLASSLRQRFSTNSGYPRPGLMRSSIPSIADFFPFSAVL